MTVDSYEYGWVDLTINRDGNILGGARGVSFKVTQAKENIKGKGSKPYRRGRADEEYEGELTILHSELISMLQQNKGMSPTSIKPFDMTLALANDVGSEIVIYILKFVEFTECEMSLSQGDVYTEVTLPIIIGDIIWPFSQE